MDLKKYIEELVRQELDEMSTTAGVPGYLTPAAFGKPGQKTNAATKYAEKEGWKRAKGMPKNSKILDYKELWPGKKSAMNESLLNLIEQELLNEVTYHKFKNEVKFRTKSEQLHKVIREVKKKLAEVVNLLQPLDKTQNVKDENIISLLQYYQLIDELKSVK